MAPPCSVYLIATVLTVLCTLLQPMFMQPEDACPDQCECTSTNELIAKRRAKAVTCIATGGSQLPSIFAASVEVLRFTNNSLRRIDFFAIRFSSLLSLELCCNGIHEIIGSGRTLPRLRLLDLSGNNLHIIQQYAFRDFPELTFLNLSWNGLHTIAPEALVLPSLRELDLRYNRLTVLRADYLKHMPNLEVLQMAHNALAAVPALVFTHSLHSLQLAHNRIIRIDDGAFEGINISGTLDLSGNALRRTPSAALKRLGRVDTLLLDDNQLRVVPSGAIVGMAARVISISKQKHLRFIQRGGFINLPELEHLKLRENIALSYIPSGAISSVPRLRELDLSGNSLLALEREFISTLPTIEHLNVANNSFLCHCSLRWLQQQPKRSFGVKCVQQETDEELELSRLPDMPTTCSPYILPLFPEIVTVELGGNTSFQCRALAVPPAKLTWISPSGLRLGNNVCNGRLCVRDHALTVRFLHRDDQGQYSCFARNSVGVISRNILVEVKDPNVQLFPLTVASTFVTLSWNISSLATNSYVLRWVSSGGELPPARSEPFSAGPRTHSYTVRGLQPGARYSFSLHMEWDQDSIELCNIILTTQPHGYLLSLGIEFNYLGAIIFTIITGSLLLGCVFYCGFRCYKRAQEGLTPERTSTLRKAELFQSTSAHSDVAFITFIDLPDNAGNLDLRESNLNLA
jgi:Leucine-rich repeat (LRR) protein